MTKLAKVAVFCIICATWCSLFAACDGQDGGTPSYTAKEIADTVIAAYDPGDMPDMKQYLYGAEGDGGNYLEPGYAGLLVNGSYEEVAEFEYLTDYAFYVPMGHYVSEVDVLKVDDVRNVGVVREMLQRRLRLKDTGDMRLYMPDEAYLLEKAVILTKDAYIVLLVTVDNDIAKGVISDIFAGNVETLVADGGMDGTGEDAGDGGDNKDDGKDGNVNGDKDGNGNSGENGNGNDNESNVEIEIRNIESYVALDLSSLVFKERQNLPPDELTATPAITIRKHSHNAMYLIGGSCELGSVIRVTGGSRDIETRSDYGDYLLEVPIDTEGISVLRLSAEVPGKATSDEITLLVRPKTNVNIFERRGEFGTIIGLDYQSVFYGTMPDYEGTNLMTESMEEALKGRIEKRIGDLGAAEVDAEIVYLIAPNPISIYKELIPEKYVYSENNLLKQFKRVAESAGATVVDLTDVMMEHKNDEYKIFHKTDSHWTEYGAYLGYVELMNHIAKRFPDAAPRPLMDFTLYNRQLLVGDIFYMLEIPEDCLRETTTFMDFGFEPPTGHKNIMINDGRNIALDHEVVGYLHQTQTNVAGDFPSAYIYRDSYGGPIYAFLTDRFSTATWQKWAQYNYKQADIISKNPDYILYIITERNIASVLWDY